jgi:acyl-CoA thioesterase-1
MIYRLFLIFLFILSPVTLQAKTILIVGDSISAAYAIPVEKGWVSLLEQRLSEQKTVHKVVNASIVGETTFGGVMRLLPLLEKHQPDIVVIELGGNDGLMGADLNDIENNLITMVGMVKETNSDVLLVPMQMPPNYGQKYMQGFASIYQQVAEKANISLTTFIYKDIAEVPDLMMSDGIHPVESAHPIMLENIWPSLSALLNKE